MGTQTAKRRKVRLFSEFGDGINVACSMKISKNCSEVLTIETMTIDRFPIPGRRGGHYVRGNMRPACYECNHLDGRLCDPMLSQKARDRLKQELRDPSTIHQYKP